MASMDQDNVPPDSMTDTSPSEPTILFQQMQILTDIEGDLADTAVAIAAPDGPDTSADKTISDSTTLQNAEAMESVLEQSILPAPVPATKEVTPDAQVNENKPTTPVEVSAAAHDASTALSGVTADLTVPVLPETVVPAAREVITDTAAEESTGNIVVEAEEPTIENITEAAVNGKNGPEEEAIKPDPVSPSEIAAAVPKQVVEAVAPASRQATPPRLSLPVQTPYASIQRANGDVTLPQGLTESSPSVITIPDLVRSWRNGGHVHESPVSVLTIHQILRTRTSCSHSSIGPYRRLKSTMRELGIMPWQQIIQQR